MIHIHVGGCNGCRSCSDTTGTRFDHLEKLFTMKLNEIAAALNTTTERVQKIGTETQGLIAKVEELKLAIENADNVPQEVQDALSALMTQVGVVDDLVADPAAAQAG